MKICRLIGIGMLTLLALPLYGQDNSGSESERLKKLENAVHKLQQRNAELENEVHQLKGHGEFAPMMGGDKEAVPGNDNKAVFTAPKPPPVNVHPGGSETNLTLGGYIQANFEDGDVSAFEGRFGLNALKDRFRLRRARITLTGAFSENFDFKLEGDLEQSDAAVTAISKVTLKNGVLTTTSTSTSNRTQFSATDVWINYHGIPEAQLKVGQYKAPFGLEQLTPDTQIYTIERSLPTGALTPERQIGAMLWGKPLTDAAPDWKDFLTYYAGIFNGNGRNFNNNDNNEFMYVGRVELMPWKGNLMGEDSFVKISGDYMHSRDDTGVNISPALNLKVNADGSLTSYTLPGPDERNAWSADVDFRLGRFDLVGEYLDERVAARTTLFNTFTANGYYVQGAFFFVPKKLQGVVKWEQLNPGQVANDGIHSLTAGLNYYVHGDNIKLMANYVHTWSDFREANPSFGDSQFDEVLLRMQVVF